jgi:hypothetical protein
LIVAAFAAATVFDAEAEFTPVVAGGQAEAELLDDREFINESKYSVGMIW